MKLYDLFSWMLNYENPLLESEPCTLDMCQLELKDALEQHKKLLAEVRVARFTQAKEAMPSKQIELDQQDAYLTFLKDCEKVLAQVGTMHACELGLNYLFLCEKDEERFQAREPLITALFCEFLRTQKGRALDYYQKNSEKFQALKPLLLRITVEKQLVAVIL